MFLAMWHMRDNMTNPHGGSESPILSMCESNCQLEYMPFLPLILLSHCKN